MTSKHASLIIAALWATTLVVFVGCGRPVGLQSGVVKFSDGSPVTSGSIEFRRTDDEVCFASRIASDGTFSPADQEGVIGLPPGTYDVVVVQIVLTEDLSIEHHTHGHSVPRRYADYYTSGLQVEVEAAAVEAEATDPIEVVIEIDESAT